MIKYLFVFSLILNISLFAQVTSSFDVIEFPEVFTNSPDSASFYIINKTQYDVTVKLNNLKDVYTLSDTITEVLSFDSVIVWLKYQPNQNVIDADIIFITSDDSSIGIAINVIGNAKYGDSYDATTFNKYDNELKSALNSLVINHYSLGYNLARDKMFMEFDNQRVNGQGAAQNTLECVYTGRLAVGYTSRTVAQNAPYNFNTEHTWPQSNFGEAEPMKSDLYHLFPTDITANGIRSNYQFGKVVSNITWQIGGSKLGNNSLGQISFEPRDVHKGDVSRSMFYFITRYPVNYGSFFTQTQENVFREWNKFDTVGVVESNRNNAIALLQLKRNPYIDHPEFVDRIYSFATSNTCPTFADLDLLPFVLNFDSTMVSDTTSQGLYIINSGSGVLSIDSITISDSHFYISNVINDIEPYTALKSELHFVPDTINNFSANLTVYSDGGIKQILLTGIGKDDAVNVEDEITTPLVFALEQNYPNPFNPSTKIKWQSSTNCWQTLKVYDVLGNEVATLINESKPAGIYEVEWNASSLSSGIYFYRLQMGYFIETKKMIVLK
ncbi:MAG: endonuclease [Ignavibacteriaceae bacterium]